MDKHTVVFIPYCYCCFTLLLQSAINYGSMIDPRFVSHIVCHDFCWSRHFILLE